MSTTDVGYYPGTNHTLAAGPRKRVPRDLTALTWKDVSSCEFANQPSNRRRVDNSGWDFDPREININGEAVYLYTIKNLARALGRREGTIRLLETKGLLPVTPWHWGSEYAEGRVRLYPRTVVEGIIAIAEEEGLMYVGAPIKKTKFTIRVKALMEEEFSAWKKAHAYHR